MGIWNEGEMPGKKEFRNPLKYGSSKLEPRSHTALPPSVRRICC